MGKREEAFSWTADDLKRLAKDENDVQYTPRRFVVFITIDENQKITYKIFFEKEGDDR